MDNLTLDAEALFAIADVIDGYCAKQREIVNVYHAQILALESEWRDDRTFNTMVEELNALRTQALAMLDDIYNIYPKYFRERAREITARPVYQGDGVTVSIPSETRSSVIGTNGIYDGYGVQRGNVVRGGGIDREKASKNERTEGTQKYKDMIGLTSNQSNQSRKAEDAVDPIDSINVKVGFWDKLFGRDVDIKQALKEVEYIHVQAASPGRTEEQIVNDISGGDLTEGSCSSLAFAYVGNKAGYVVYDFRGGESRRVFSSRDMIGQIASMKGVKSVIKYGENDGICAELLMSQMQTGKEYYLATGRHAAIVRQNADVGYQYLELQNGNPSNNGWHPLTQQALYSRFACEDRHSTEWSNYLIDMDSLQGNAEFMSILGYINTDKSAQMKGENGHER